VQRTACNDTINIAHCEPLLLLLLLLLPNMLAVSQYGQSHFFKLPGGKLKPDEDGETCWLGNCC
jgi:hypothetical protein